MGNAIPTTRECSGYQNFCSGFLERSPPPSFIFALKTEDRSIELNIHTKGQSNFEGSLKIYKMYHLKKGSYPWLFIEGTGILLCSCFHCWPEKRLEEFKALLYVWGWIFRIAISPLSLLQHLQKNSGSMGCKITISFFVKRA